MSEPTLQIDEASFKNRFVEYRPLLLALGFSLGLHVAVMLIVFAVSVAHPMVEIEFEESRGVALIGRLGYVPVDDDPTNDIEVDELPDELPEDIELVVVDPEPEEEVAEAIPEVEDTEPEVEDTTPEETAPSDEEAALTESDVVVPPERTPEEEAALEAAREARRERRHRRREARAEAAAQAEREAAEAAAQEAAEASQDPMALPPAQRYPEGTLNPIATDIGMWGPEGARVVVITRNDRIRSSRQRRNIETLLSSLPDWQMLVGNGDIDPFRDVDAMLIATSNPRVINRTFVAALHHLPPNDVIDALSSGFPGGVEWDEQSGRIYGTPRGGETLHDPRVFMLPADRLFIYARPEFIDPLESHAPRARGLDAAAEHIAHLDVEPDLAAEDVVSGNSLRTGRLGNRRGRRDRGTSEETTTAEDADALAAQEEADQARRAARRARRNNRSDDEPPLREDGWVRGLLELSDFGGTGRDGAAIVITLNDFATLRFAGMGRVEPPRSAHLSVDLQQDPVITGRMVFSNQADAEAFVGQWPRVLDANATQLRLTGFYTPMQEMVWEIDHNEATFTLIVPDEAVGRLADTVSALMRATHSD